MKKQFYYKKLLENDRFRHNFVRYKFFGEPLRQELQEYMDGENLDHHVWVISNWYLNQYRHPAEILHKHIDFFDDAMFNFHEMPDMRMGQFLKEFSENKDINIFDVKI